MASQWAAGESSVDQGLAITAGEVARVLSDPAEAEERDQRTMQASTTAPALLAAARAADDALSADSQWTALLGVFGLGAPEADLLCLLLAVEFDPRLQRVVAYLHDDARAVAPTPMLAASLFRSGASVPADVDALLRWRLAQTVDGGSAWRGSTGWQADPAVAISLTRGAWRDPALDGVVTAIGPECADALPCVYPHELAALHAFGATADIALIGVEGSGRRTLAAQFAATLNRPLLIVDCAALAARPGPLEDGLIAAARMARAVDAVPYWNGSEAIPAALWSRTRGLLPLQMRADRQTTASATAAIDLPKLTRVQRVQTWRQHSTAPPPAILGTHQLTPGEIARAAHAAAGGSAAIRTALRRAMPVQSELLHLLPCPFGWDDLVVPPDVLAQLREFEAQVRFRWDVYEEWGFARLTPLGNGIAALFGGPSGTGKTMAAQVIARSLELDLYRVDLAGVVNKYIGETEKRLRDVFDSCERAGALLFFDEADALFGSRMQVKDSHDRFANIEIDYLLQRIERFDGVAILATNRKNDLDSAFLRRLRFVVDFLRPAPAERLALWERALRPASPVTAPLHDDIDFSFLATRLEMTGAQIKATALAAAFLARAEERPIGMRHIGAAAQRELAKHGEMLRSSLAGAAS